MAQGGCRASEKKKKYPIFAGIFLIPLSVSQYAVAETLKKDQHSNIVLVVN
jgi:hypothetical protein